MSIAAGRLGDLARIMAQETPAVAPSCTHLYAKASSPLGNKKSPRFMTTAAIQADKVHVTRTSLTVP